LVFQHGLKDFIIRRFFAQQLLAARRKVSMAVLACSFFGLAVFSIVLAWKVSVSPLVSISVSMVLSTFFRQVHKHTPTCPTQARQSSRA